MIQFDKISRWLYRSESYSISAVTTSPHGRWRVSRNGYELGFAGTLEGAMTIANDDARLVALSDQVAKEIKAELPAWQEVVEWNEDTEGGYLTDGHGRAIMVPEARDDERTTSVTDAFNTCQCYSNYTEEELDGQTVRVFTSCGATIPRKRTFKAGHDAKYKSALQWAFRAGVPFIYIDGGVRTEADPVKLAKERGWGHFMTAKPKKAKKASKAALADALTAQIADDGKDNTGVDHADDQPDAEVPAGYHPARVKYRNKWRDGSVVNETANTVTVEFDNKGTPKQITLDKDSDKLEVG